MLPRAELAAWLRLTASPGVGRATARRLLAALGAAERVLAADEDTLLALAGHDAVRTLKRRDPRDDAQLDGTLRWLEGGDRQAPRDVVTLGDPRYPASLLEAPDPPLLLFTLGRAELLAAEGIAIVGSRSATPQGLDNARAFARFLGGRGLVVVSGLATGIDGAAHEGALAGDGGTVAFVGTGLDRCYPRGHARLMQRIAEHGLVASEYPPGMDALAQNFPRRNRLIAGLTLGTLVVEAAVESGSLITARMAVEAGREVFAIPGSIHSPQSRGCHRLIQEGAKLVETGDDVLRELRFRASPAPATLSPPAPSPLVRADDPPPEDALLAALGYDPVTSDALAARTGLRAHELAARLLTLELAGTVQRLPGGLFQRLGRA